ncbi:MAG TPA: M23 family metallopeptidase [Geobacteraceae bacterium]
MKSLQTLCIICILALSTVALAARQSPVDGGVLTSGPGQRIDPFGSGRTVWHNGWDIAVPMGTPVYPTQEGTVYFAGEYKGYGNLVAVEHGKGVITFYGHNSELLVRTGQFVTPKTVIARSGNSGRSTGPHVHYEVRQLPARQQKERQEQLAAQLKTAVTGKVDQLVENFVTGKGGPETESFLPPDIDQ